MYFKRCFGKKGSLLDSIYIAVATVVLSIFIVFGYLIISSTNAEVQAMDGVSPTAKTAYEEVDNKYVGVMDTAFILFWLASLVGSLIGAWFIDSHPIFFVLSIFVLVVIMLGVVPLSNVVETTLSDENVASTTANFPILTWFSSNFFVIVAIQSFLILFALYAKVRVFE